MNLRYPISPRIEYVIKVYTTTAIKSRELIKFRFLMHLQMAYSKFGSNTKWENIVGYSRAVKCGKHIEISGTVATDGKQVIGLGDPYLQAQFILSKIKNVLEEMGADLTNVIRTRIYVTDIRQWENVGRAHGEFFGSIKPATSMVEISALIHKDYLVEIEATAILPD